MLSPQRATRGSIAIATAVVAIATIWFARGHWLTVYDDALIYLRYVKNLHAGCGLAFNCGDAPVEAFTSPLYLALLWVGSFATSQWIALTQVLGIVFVVATGGLAAATAAALARDDERPALAPVAALVTGGVLALDPYVLLNANTGMETGLGAAAVSLVAFAAVTKRPRLLVGAAVVVTLVRPEGLLFVLALPLIVRTPRLLIAAAIALVAITAVRYAIFGDFLPNTYYAKSGGTWRHAELGLAYIADCVRDFPVCLVAVLAVRRAPYLLAVAGAWLLFFVRTGGDTFEYSRLWFPLVPALTALGLSEGVRLARRRRALLAVAPVVALAAGVRAWVSHAIPPQGTSERVIEWAQVGTYLHDHTPKGTLIATVPIGAIAYYSNRPILDLVGLADRTIAHAGRSVPTELLTKNWIGHERNDTEYVLQRAPALIVTTMRRDSPWTPSEVKVGFWSEWLLLQKIKTNEAPYHVRDLEVTPGVHVLAFEHD